MRRLLVFEPLSRLYEIRPPVRDNQLQLAPKK